MKQLKDIFASKATLWLFLELIIITVVAWAVFEPAIVNLYYRSLSLGYDNDRLLYAKTAVISDGILHDAFEMTEERHDQILRQLMAVEGVESAYLFDQPYGSMGYSQAAFNECCAGGDTLLLANVTLTTDSHFFETYGLKPLPGSPSAEELSHIKTVDKQVVLMPGSPSAEELSHIKTVDKQVVLTRSGAIALFGTEDVVGRHFTICYEPAYEVTVAGVVEDFRMSVPTTIRSMIITTKELQTTSCQYVIRLKKGVNASRFVEEHGQDLIRSGRTGFNRISNLMTFDEYLQQLELDDGRTQEVNRSLALALFFLINLMLAVIGTVWLHAKRRTEECGVRRAFGATRWRVFFDFLWRNALLATAAVIIGCIIYLNYAHSGIQEYDGGEYYETLYTIQGAMLSTDKIWVDYFWPHFLVVSSVVYIIILCTVLIGTAIPAVKIIGSKITNALRDE